MDTLLLLLAPTAPHLAEELWSLTGHTGSIHLQTWPDWDAELIKEEFIQVPVQVNGKLRTVLEVVSSIDEIDIQQMALSHEKILPHISKMTITRIIYVPGKALNIVTGK